MGVRCASGSLLSARVTLAPGGSVTTVTLTSSLAGWGSGRGSSGGVTTAAGVDSLLRPTTAPATMTTPMAATVAMTGPRRRGARRGGCVPWAAAPSSVVGRGEPLALAGAPGPTGPEPTDDPV